MGLFFLKVLDKEIIFVYLKDHKGFRYFFEILEVCCSFTYPFINYGGETASTGIKKLRLHVEFPAYS